MCQNYLNKGVYILTYGIFETDNAKYILQTF